MLQKSVAVTGANGFIGLHIVKSFLERNYKVVATVRDHKNQDKTKDLLSLPNSQQNLQIVSADLQSQQGFLEAFKDVEVVVHNAALVASGAHLTEDDFVKPVVEGVDNVMQAVLHHKNSIKNVVYVSSMSAVCGAPGSKPVDHKFSSEDWSCENNQRERKVWYSLSKTLSELKFNSYSEQLKQNNILATSICPTLVIGPILQSTLNNSVEMVVNFLTGKKDVIPNFSMSLVDVRDVAEMIYQSVNKQAEGRFISVEQGYTFEEIAEFLRKHGGENSKNVPTNVAEGEKAIPSQFELAKSKDLLGRPFITGEQSIKDMVDSIYQKKLL